MVHLWNLIVSIIIIFLVAGIITSGITAYENNKNPTVIPCPFCGSDCNVGRTPNGQEVCPADPQNCTEGQCMFNYMNFPSNGVCFIIAPITTHTALLFSNLTSADSGTMVLAPYGATAGLAFQYQAGGYLLNTNTPNRLTIDPTSVIPIGNDFTSNGYALVPTTELDTEAATFELSEGLIIAKHNNLTYYLAVRTYNESATPTITSTIIVAIRIVFPANRDLYPTNLFRPTVIGCPP